MHTPKLPIQDNFATPAPKAARAKNPSDDGGQFSQTLSREQELRKSPMIPARAPVPAKPAAQAKAPPPARPPEKAAEPKNAAAEPARKAEANTAKTDSAERADAASAAAAADAAAADAAAAAAAATPMADMLALVASFNQGAPAVIAPPADGAEAQLVGNARRAAIELPLDSAVELPQAAKHLLAGQGLTDIAPVATGTSAPPLEAVADNTFTNMMARADGSALEGVKQGALEVAKDSGRAFERALPPAGLERAGAGARAGADLAAPSMLKAMPEPAQLATARGREMAADIAPIKELQATAPVTAPLQQAALSVAQAVNGVPASDRIPARVGTPAWDNQVAQKIVWMVGGAEQSASLTLNPPDLGPLQVVLSVTNDMATVTFSSAQPEVRQALEDALPKLRDMMSENGISLGDANVNDGAPGQQANGQGARQGGGAQRAELGQGPTNGSASEAAARNAARPARAGESAGLVDTFA